MADASLLLADGGLPLIQILALFLAAAFAMGFGALIVGKLLRPSRSNPDKESAYECGEVPVGAGWVQFDLRFYVVALVFLIFDVEIALFYPWAVVFGGGATAEGSKTAWQALWQVRWAGLWDMLFFFLIIVVGFVYLLRFGYLNWVRLVNPQHEEHRLRELVPTPSQTIPQRPMPAMPAAGTGGNGAARDGAVAPGTSVTAGASGNATAPVGTAATSGS